LLVCKLLAKVVSATAGTDVDWPISCTTVCCVDRTSVCWADLAEESPVSCIDKRVASCSWAAAVSCCCEAVVSVISCCGTAVAVVSCTTCTTVSAVRSSCGSVVDDIRSGGAAAFVVARFCSDVTVGSSSVTGVVAALVISCCGVVVVTASICDIDASSCCWVALKLLSNSLRIFSDKVEVGSVATSPAVVRAPPVIVTDWLVGKKATSLLAIAIAVASVDVVWVVNKRAFVVASVVGASVVVVLAVVVDDVVEVVVASVLVVDDVVEVGVASVLVVDDVVEVVVASVLVVDDLVEVVVASVLKTILRVVMSNFPGKAPVEALSATPPRGLQQRLFCRPLMSQFTNLQNLGSSAPPPVGFISLSNSCSFVLLSPCFSGSRFSSTTSGMTSGFGLLVAGLRASGTVYSHTHQL
jgi:hypothetical protein